jgi:hypothetical protein
MDVLPQLVESGRKVLLFSQFTSMLDLIAAELDDNKISYVQLRGDTRDRATPVKRFQNGDVPVFLISLKAGGTGLNLTAADTVIHYDPWWNPAVENQATDRAHRIGQDKPVFVYKMIATGTIEERILEMQKRKQAIADAVFDADRAGTVAITEDDLAYLLAPIDARSSAASAKPVKNKQSASVSLSNNPASTDRSRSNSRLKNVKKRDNSLVMSITIDELDAGTLDRPSSRSSKSSDNNGDGDIEPIDPFARALLKHGVSPKDLVLAFTPPNKNRSTNKNPKRAAKK